MGLIKRSPSLDFYLNAIGQFPLLSREEEVELTNRCLYGDKSAEEQLAKANLRFVVNVAKIYAWSDIAQEDLINAGNVGLARAIKLFKPDRGARLISYAVWPIRQAMLEEITKFQNIVSSRTDREREFASIRKVLEAAVAGQDGKPLSLDRLRELGITETQMVEARSTSTHQSLDAAFMDSDESLHDILKDERTPSPDAGMKHEQYVELLNQLLDALTEEEKAIFRYLSGQYDGRTHTLKEAAEHFNLSTTKVSARFGVANRKLKIAASKMVKEGGGSLFAK